MRWILPTTVISEKMTLFYMTPFDMIILAVFGCFKIYEFNPNNMHIK